MDAIISLKNKRAVCDMAKGKAEKEKSAGKTNVMRLLDAAKIPYEAKTYPVDEADLSGSHAADLMGVDHGSMFKTLVLKGERTGYLVCCIRWTTRWI